MSRAPNSSATRPIPHGQYARDNGTDRSTSACRLAMRNPKGMQHSSPTTMAEAQSCPSAILNPWAARGHAQKPMLLSGNITQISTFGDRAACFR